MAALGYDRYAVHETDVGGGVASLLPMVDREHVLGIHIAGTVAAMPFGPPLAYDGLSPRDRVRAERFNEMRETGIGYLHLQATRPMTLAHALNDSPAGQLAWIVDRFRAGIDPAAERLTGAVDIDQLPTNVALYWFTGSGASSANAVYEGMHAWRQMAGAEPDVGRSESAPLRPTAVAVFAGDTTIRSVMDPAGRLDRWSEFDRGGHFPAMETPELLAEDLSTFFAEIR